MDVAEIKKLDSYLKRLFGSPRIRVVPRPQRDDYAEVMLGEEPFGRPPVLGAVGLEGGTDDVRS